ncbi:MAG: hypothetical protein JRE16_09710 [Deltaproteobacteria bacterium]|nr:hypothetical protein [Deltaproteobacteria bacterium]MBW2519344.1 hypothetical protein [Deltaproteobacteria bacterium]
MGDILYLRCQHCGNALANRQSAYCPPCYLTLSYQAMPILLGMVLSGDLSLDLNAFRGRSSIKPIPTYLYPHAKDILD